MTCSAWPPDSTSSPPSGSSGAPTSGSASSVFSTVPPASLGASAWRVSSSGAVEDVVPPGGAPDGPSPSAAARRCAACSSAS
eukprot:2248755-Pleurochrysis_carterae.AAC.1